MTEVTKAISKTDKKNNEVRYSVEEISNGWILCKSTEGKDKKGNYQFTTVKTFFKENPLDDSVLSKVGKMKQALGKTDDDGDEIA